MPAGPSELGFVYFAAAKYAGYTAFCAWFLQPRVREVLPENTPLPSPWISGAIRTLLGLAIGAVVGIGFWRIPFSPNHEHLASILFFALLVPVRVGEWWLLLRIMYGDIATTGTQKSSWIAVGIVVSFALDFLAILSAFVLPGGAWVC